MNHAYIYIGNDALEEARRETRALSGDIIEVTNEYYGEKTSDMILIETMRKMRQDAYIRPYGDYKVFIINDADAMNKPAQNAILKVLEEPPEYCIFFLVAQNEKKLLETVRSRAVIKRFEKDLPEERDEELEQLLEGITTLDASAPYKVIAYFERNKEKRNSLLNASKTFFRNKLLSNPEKDGKMFARFLEKIEETQQALKHNANYTMSITCLMLSGWEEFNDRDYRSQVQKRG